MEKKTKRNWRIVTAVVCLACTSALAQWMGLPQFKSRPGSTTTAAQHVFYLGDAFNADREAGWTVAYGSSPTAADSMALKRTTSSVWDSCAAVYYGLRTNLTYDLLLTANASACNHAGVVIPSLIVGDGTNGTVLLGGYTSPSVSSAAGAVNVNTTAGANVNISGTAFLTVTTTQTSVGQLGATGPINTGSGFQMGGVSGISATLTVRDSLGTGTCTISVSGGIITGSSC